MGVEGNVTFGTYETEREAAGWDMGASLLGSWTEGSVADFTGRSDSVEVDIPVPGVTLEGGITEGGKKTGSLEFGGSLPTGPANVAGSFGNNNATVEETGHIDWGDVGAAIQSIPDQIADALNLPRTDTEDRR